MRFPPTKRTLTVNANGPVYGSTELSTAFVPVLDPARHKPSSRASGARSKYTVGETDPLTPSPYWGADRFWDS